MPPHACKGAGLWGKSTWPQDCSRSWLRFNRLSKIFRHYISQAYCSLAGTKKRSGGGWGTGAGPKQALNATQAPGFWISGFRCSSSWFLDVGLFWRTSSVVCDRPFHALPDAPAKTAKMDPKLGVSNASSGPAWRHIRGAPEHRSGFGRCGGIVFFGVIAKWTSDEILALEASNPVRSVVQLRDDVRPAGRTGGHVPSMCPSIGARPVRDSVFQLVTWSLDVAWESSRQSILLLTW